MTTKWIDWLDENGGGKLAEELRYMAAEPWKPEDADREAAWTFYNELRTRITAEPLDYRGGDEVAALDSLHDLFQIARDTINYHGPDARHFAILARTLLNSYLRPFTSKWHRQHLRGQLTRQDRRRTFRQELLALQASLTTIIHVFGKLAEADQYVPEPTTERSARHSFNANRVWPTHFLGPKYLGCDREAGDQSRDPILKTEQDDIIARRTTRYASQKEKKYGGLGAAARHHESVGMFGLAISGGGIRSATFALGVLQKLADRQILKDADYLSTVSGGGYVGSFLSANLLSEAENEDDDAKLKQHDAKKLLVRDDPAPETDQVRRLRNHSKEMKGGGVFRTLLEISWRLLVLVAQGLIVAVLVPLLFFSLYCLLLILFDSSSTTLSDPLATWCSWFLRPSVFAIASVSLFVLYMLLQKINKRSLHPLYRRRLAEAYIVGEDRPDPPKLSSLRNAKQAPYHLICAAVNLPSSKNRELRGRKSDFFVFTPHHIGSVLTGYQNTEDVEVCDDDLDLATAMAISGAAVSTHAGTLSKRWYARVALWFVRLGYWMPNPKIITPGISTRPGAKPWFGPRVARILPEVLGRFDEDDTYVNVSDGGHIENLGIYELLRRRCKFILCIDGEHDPEQRCAGLVKACRFAWIDMGINIDIDLEELRADETGLCQAHASMGTINYNRRDSGTEEVGYLLYLKLSMTGNERDYIHEYRHRHPTFPHQTTMDQFYDEDQFEAYRALGNHVADDLFKKELIGDLRADEFKTRAWLERLVRALEPPPPRSSKT